MRAASGDRVLDLRSVALPLLLAFLAFACAPAGVASPTDERFVFFALASADVSGVDGFFSLGYVTAYLDAAPRLRILVVGHADGRGSVEANRTLSFRRANAVRAALVSHGVAVERIDIGAVVEAAQGSVAAVARRADLYVYDPSTEAVEKRLPKGVEIRKE